MSALSSSSLCWRTGGGALVSSLAAPSFLHMAGRRRDRQPGRSRAASWRGAAAPWRGAAPGWPRGVRSGGAGTATGPAGRGQEGAAPGWPRGGSGHGRGAAAAWPRASKKPRRRAERGRRAARERSSGAWLATVGERRLPPGRTRARSGHGGGERHRRGDTRPGGGLAGIRGRPRADS
ncbi:hypothetical protein PAHAL_9G144700 [Panicum hallii]|uniref:Uncharacterized protein n=1 Tax=Panicum hallii TaxID=206008 RepID=A0A2T8I1D0_9POAL|nr:hypothetical protein PAHAL_9G144700 [Panicum hallii]